MSWDAGAITGQVILDTGQFTGPIQQVIGQAVQAGHAIGEIDGATGQARNALGQFVAGARRAGDAAEHAGDGAHGWGGELLHTLGVMEMFHVAAESMMELPLKLVEKAFDLAKEAVSRFFEAIVDVGNVAQKMGLDALKAGVDVKFFSEISEAAKRVGIDADQLGQSFKFLQKNAVDALGGMNQEAAGGFAALGISTQFLKEHLNDTQAIFTEVKEKIGALPDAAERTRVSMQILGRAGSDMIPLFVQSNEQMQESIDLATRLGAVEDESSTEGAEGWVKAKAAFSDMWEGISRAVGEPILEYLTKHWDDVRAAVLSFTDTVISAVPAAMAVIVDVVKPVMYFIEGVMHDIAWIEEKVGYLFGSSALQQSGTHLQSLVNHLEQLRNGLDEVTASSQRFAEQWRQNARAADGGFDTGTLGKGDVYNNITVHVGPDAGHGLQEAGDALHREAENRQRKARGSAGRSGVARATGAKPPMRLF